MCCSWADAPPSHGCAALSLLLPPLPQLQARSSRQQLAVNKQRQQQRFQPCCVMCGAQSARQGALHSLCCNPWGRMSQSALQPHWGEQRGLAAGREVRRMAGGGRMGRGGGGVRIIRERRRRKGRRGRRRRQSSSCQPAGQHGCTSCGASPNSQPAAAAGSCGDGSSKRSSWWPAAPCGSALAARWWITGPRCALRAAWRGACTWRSSTSTGPTTSGRRGCWGSPTPRCRPTRSGGHLTGCALGAVDVGLGWDLIALGVAVWFFGWWPDPQLLAPSGPLSA